MPFPPPPLIHHSDVETAALSAASLPQDTAPRQALALPATTLPATQLLSYSANSSASPQAPSV